MANKASPDPRARKGKGRRRRFRRMMKWTFIAGTVAFIVGLGVATGVVAGALRTIPTIADKKPKPILSSRVFDADGQEITKLYRTENRLPVSIDRLPRHAQDAFVAVEDERFWQHPGVDATAIARALYNDIRNRPLQGASTITQQLARNAFPIGRERSMRRKIQEAVLALELERRYTKKEILEMYLNQIYFGRDAYGLEAAAQTYFGNTAEKLTLAEAALLAGLPQAPNDYEPIGNPENARKRRNVVLGLMAQNGFVAAAAAEKAQGEPVKTVPQRSYIDYPAPHFVDYVLAQLLQKYPAEQVYQGGLRVYTTLDLKVQKAADEALAKHLDKDWPLNGKKEAPQAAMVVLDQQTGYVKAIVGGRSHHKVLELNRAWYNPRAGCCVRQPGSAFKPLAVYLPALQKGLTAATVFEDNLADYPSGTGDWTPKNYDHKYLGPTTLREAVRRSINTVAVKTLQKVTVRTGYEMAEKLGISTLVPTGPTSDKNLAMALGGLTRGASVMDMARAYAAIANGGNRIEPIAILRVEDTNGNVLEQNRPTRTQVVKPETAYVMTDILRSGVENQPNGGWLSNWGTATGAKVPNWPTAGKTGTTSDNKDIWFVGFTPRYTAAVWIGYDNPRRSDSLPKQMMSGKQPSWIFRDAMAEVHKGLKPQEFPKPGRGLVTRAVSVVSGNLASEETPAAWVRKELFVAGTEPKTYDGGWVKMVVCKEKPETLFDDACGCTPEERWFLPAPEGAAKAAIGRLYAPTASCLGVPAEGGDTQGGAQPGDNGAEPGTTQPGTPAGGNGGTPGTDTGAGAGAGGGAGAGNNQGDGSQQPPAGDTGADSVTTLRVTAGTGGFSPSVLRAQAGSRVRLSVQAVDSDHRLESPELGIVLPVAAGLTGTVEVIAPKSGAYLIRCALHGNETIRLVVTP